jgi:hypothetical protein
LWVWRLRRRPSLVEHSEQVVDVGASGTQNATGTAGFQ